MRNFGDRSPAPYGSWVSAAVSFELPQGLLVWVGKAMEDARRRTSVFGKDISQQWRQVHEAKVRKSAGECCHSHEPLLLRACGSRSKH